MTQAMKSLLAAQDLKPDQAMDLFTEMLSGNMDDIHIASALTALKLKGETGIEISTLVQLLRDKANPISVPNGLYADCCGTGGDGLGTFNVSTAAAITVSACGLAMVKHGNRAASSPSGSADIIERLGISLDASAEQSTELLNKEQFCFLFAPAYHPLVGRVMPVRKSLATPTIFNLAGPLANPTAPPIQLMGVANPDLLRPMAEVLQQIGCQRGLVVFGNGLDEIALHGSTQAIVVDAQSLTEITLSPETVGLKTRPLKDIQLQASDDALDVFESVINGTASESKLSMVALNAGMLLWLAGLEETQKQGVERAYQALADGVVRSKLQAIQAHAANWSQI